MVICLFLHHSLGYLGYLAIMTWWYRGLCKLKNISSCYIRVLAIEHVNLRYKQAVGSVHKLISNLLTIFLPPVSHVQIRSLF